MYQDVRNTKSLEILQHQKRVDHKDIPNEAQAQLIFVCRRISFGLKVDIGLFTVVFNILSYYEIYKLAKVFPYKFSAKAVVVNHSQSAQEGL